MKKMRKLISLIMALAFIFSMAVPAMAAEPTAQEVAGNRLLSLSVIDGYPGGGLGLDKTITRAEVAVVLAKISGMGSAADLLKDTPSKFSDVQANQWYTGWINLASAQGWVKGDPQGTFRPNDPVQYREMVTMLLKALGYNDNLPGDWPTNYLAKAASLGITKGIVTDAKAAAVRGDVFIMTSRTLDKDTVSYDKDNDKFVASGKSLLEDKMEFAKVSGVVTDIPRVSSLKDNQIRIDGKVYKVVGDVDYEEIFGAEINAWLNDDDEVVFVDITSDSVLYDAVEWNSSKAQLKLVDADAKYDLAKGVKVFIDGASKGVSDLGANYEYAKVVLDEDGDVAFIDAYNWNDFIVVEKLDKDVVVGYGDEIDAEDYTIVKDGKAIAVSDLKQGDIFFYNTSAEYAEVYNESLEGEISRIFDDLIVVDGKDYKYANTVYGFAKYIGKSDKITDLNPSGSPSAEDVVDSMKDAGKVSVFVDRNGSMIFLSGKIDDLKTSSFYGFLTKDALTYWDKDSEKVDIQLINDKDEKVTYTFSHSAVKTGPADTDYDLEISHIDNAGNVTDDYVPANAGATFAKDTILIQHSLVKVELNNSGDITKITVLDTDLDAEADLTAAGSVAAVIHPNDTLKTDKKYWNGIKINSNAIVFNAENYFGDPSDLTTLLGNVKDDITVTTFDKLSFDTITGAKAYVSDGKVVAFVIVTSDGGDSTTYAAVASKDGTKSSDDIGRITLIVDGVEKVYYSRKSASAASDIDGTSKGDLVDVTLYDASSEIKAIAPAANTVSGVVSNLNTSDKEFDVPGDAGMRLGSDGVVVDATDSYKIISFSSLKNGDTVEATRVYTGSKYVNLIVRTIKYEATAPTVVETALKDAVNATGTVTVTYDIAKGDAAQIRLVQNDGTIIDFKNITEAVADAPGQTITLTASVNGVHAVEMYVAGVKIGEILVSVTGI